MNKERIIFAVVIKFYYYYDDYLLATQILWQSMELVIELNVFNLNRSTLYKL